MFTLECVCGSTMVDPKHPTALHCCWEIGPVDDLNGEVCVCRKVGLTSFLVAEYYEKRVLTDGHSIIGRIFFLEV